MRKRKIYIEFKKERPKGIIYFEVKKKNQDKAIKKKGK